MIGHEAVRDCAKAARRHGTQQLRTGVLDDRFVGEPFDPPERAAGQGVAAQSDVVEVREARCSVMPHVRGWSKMRSTVGEVGPYTIAIGRYGRTCSRRLKP